LGSKIGQDTGERVYWLGSWIPGIGLINEEIWKGIRRRGNNMGLKMFLIGFLLFGFLGKRRVEEEKLIEKENKGNWRGIFHRIASKDRNH
jgi:hypothetical protein